MKSFDPTYLSALSIPHRVVGIVRKLGEYKGRQELHRQQVPEALENLRRVAVIQSTESSNRIEGITADHERIRKMVEENVAPADRTEGEIAGYRDVLNTIHQNHAGIPFTPNVVLQLHRDMMKYAGKEGGRWKSSSNEITEQLPDGSTRLRFQPVAPHETERFMSELHARYAAELTEQTWEPLLLVAFYVLDFLCVHPFLDGNGRMARLLTVLGLYHHGYDVGRYISLERVIEKTKESYYDTLYASSQGWHTSEHDIWPWTEYFLGVLLAAYDEFEQRVQRVSSIPGTKTAMVISAIDGFLGEFTIADVERACPLVSRDMIRHLLNKLRKEGKVEGIGAGRGSKWRKIEG